MAGPLDVAGVWPRADEVVLGSVVWCMSDFVVSDSGAGVVETP